MTDLYNEILTEHNMHPCHKHELANADFHRHGINPTCGDEITLSLKLDDDIIEEAASGMPAGKEFLKITDRKSAIEKAVALSRPGDLILIAGKGHENYQEINGVRHHFDDREILKNLSRTAG